MSISSYEKNIAVDKPKQSKVGKIRCIQCILINPKETPIWMTMVWGREKENISEQN